MEKDKDHDQDKKTRHLAMRRLKHDEVPQGVDPTVKLHDHQLKFFIGFAGNPNIKGALMVFEVGTGKTLTSILCLAHWLRQKPENRVVVLTPKSLVPNFVHALERFDPKLARDERIVVTSYEQFVVRRDIKCNNSLVIIDEAHILRKESKGVPALSDDPAVGGFFSADTDQPTGKATRVEQIMARCTHLASSKVLLLTATVFISSLNNLNNLVAMINKTQPLGKGVLEAHLDDVEFLRRHLACRVSFYRVPDEVRRQHYPQVKVLMAKWTMSPEYLKVYYEVEKNFILENQQFKDKLTTMTDMRPFYNGVRRSSILIGEDSATKIQNMIKVYRLNNDRRDQKMIVFTNFRTFGVKQIEHTLVRHQIRYAVIDGSTTSSSRDRAVLLYNRNEIQVLVLTNAAAVGLDLKGTRKIVVTELPWSWSQVQQIIGRGDRFDSHAHLPEKDRNLNVYIMTELKPVESALFDKFVDEMELIKKRAADATELNDFFRRCMLRETDDATQQMPSSDYYMYFYIMVMNIKFEKALTALERLDDVYACWKRNTIV